MNLRTKFGYKMQAIRIEREFSIEELEKKYSLEAGTIERMERGDTSFPIEVLMLLLMEYGYIQHAENVIPITPFREYPFREITREEKQKKYLECLEFLKRKGEL